MSEIQKSGDADVVFFRGAQNELCSKHGLKMCIKGITCDGKHIDKNSPLHSSQE